MDDGELGDAELVTARLALRRPAREDTGAIFSIHSDPRACVHNPSDALTTREDAGRLFERWDEHWRQFGFGYWVVRWRISDVPVGFCGVKVMHLAGRHVLNLFAVLIRWRGAMVWAAKRAPRSPGGPPGGFRSIP